MTTDLPPRSFLRDAWHLIRVIDIAPVEVGVAQRVRERNDRRVSSRRRTSV